jgi:hypothetical protein
MASKCILVLLFPRDFKFIGQIFGRLTHDQTAKAVGQALPDAVNQLAVSKPLSPTHIPTDVRSQAHVLDPASDLDVRIPALNILEGIDDGLKTRGTVALNGIGRNGNGKTGQETDNPGQVGRVAVLQYATEDHFLNQIGIQTRSVEETLDDLPSKFLV